MITPEAPAMADRTIGRRRFLGLLSAATGALTLGPIAPARAAGLTIAHIRESGKLRIGVEAAYVPFTFRQEGKIVGYDVDLADIFCKSLNVKPDIIDTAWAGVIPSLYAKKFDIVMTSMSYTAERLQRVLFTIPYAEASQALLVRTADAATIKGVDDLAGKIVGIKLGSPGEILVKKHEEQLKAKKSRGFAEVKVFNDHPAAYLALGQSKVDVVYNTIPTLAMVLRDQPGKFVIVKGIGADNWAGIAARKEDTEVVEFLNGELKRLKADDTLYKLQEKWFGFRMHLADTVPKL
jgi:polar amino acid transport system substrate-binding protein